MSADDYVLVHYESLKYIIDNQNPSQTSSCRAIRQRRGARRPLTKTIVETTVYQTVACKCKGLMFDESDV